MSVMDAGQEFSNAQALGAISSGAVVVSTNIIDNRASQLDEWQNSRDPDLGGSVFNVGVNVALVGAGLIRAQLVTKEADAAISSGGTILAEVHIPTITAAGKSFGIKIPPGMLTKRYLGVLFFASGAITSATVDSWLSLDLETADNKKV